MKNRLDLGPTDLNINRDHLYSSRTIYLQRLKFLGQSILDLSVAQGVGDWHNLWPTDLNINRDHLHIKGLSTFPVWSLGKAILSYLLQMTFDLDLYINRDNLLVFSSKTIYLPSLELLGQSNLDYLILNVWETEMTFDLNINRDYLLIKDYLPTTFGASGAKKFWVI